MPGVPAPQVSAVAASGPYQALTVGQSGSLIVSDGTVASAGFSSIGANAGGAGTASVAVAAFGWIPKA
jgi:hypothetical protein